MSLVHLGFAEMFERENKTNTTWDQSLQALLLKDISKSINGGMAFEAAERKFKRSPKFTTKPLKTLPSFKSLSLQIPMSDGYHESFSLDCLFS